MPNIPVPMPINEPHLFDKYEVTMYPIEYALIKNDPAMLKKFIDAGADPNIDLGNGWTLLHTAISLAIDGMAQNSRKTYAPNILEIIKILLKHGGDLNIKDPDGLKPLDIINEYAADKDGFDTLVKLFKRAIPNVEKLVTYDGGK